LNSGTLKNYSDAEIYELLLQALREIRGTALQYGEIKITVSGGKVKFLTVEKPIEFKIPV